MARSKKRLEELLIRLESGEDVAVRDLKNVLTQVEFEQYEHEWEWIQDVKKGHVFDDSSEYDALLKKGDFYNNKAESKRFNHVARKKFARQAESTYELALEQLQSDIERNPGIVMAYDRPASTLEAGVDLSYHGMPRKVTSKSLQNQHNVISSSSGGSTIVKAVTTKRDLKCKALKQSLDNFDSNEEYKEIRKEGVGGIVQSVQSVKEGQSSKLKQMLTNLKK
jgi:hypothetical protein